MYKKALLILLMTASTFANHYVRLQTTEGNIILEIYSDNPILKKTTKNFLELSKNGYYENTVFHRVIPKFMIQGGDPTGTGTGGKSIYGQDFEDEFDNFLDFSRPGVVAMANRGAATNGSQFFITTKATPWLNGKHSIFGKVVSGWDTIEKIERSEKNTNNKPLKDIEILKVDVKIK